MPTGTNTKRKTLGEDEKREDTGVFFTKKEVEYLEGTSSRCIIYRCCCNFYKYIFVLGFFRIILTVRI